MSRLLNMWHILTVIILISLLLSVSACFQIVGPESAYTNLPKTITVTAPPPATTPTPASASPGIVGLWHFDNNTLESTGLGNSGAFIGGASFADSMPGFGKAVSSGIRSYGFRVPTRPNLDITTSLTLEAWVKLDSLPERSPVVGKVNRENTQNSYQLLVGEDGHVGLTVWKDQEVTSNLSGDTPLNLGEWYHIAGSYKYVGDGTSVMRVFVNGRLDGELNDAVGPVYVGTADLMIGRLNGLVDEVHVWNTPYADYALAAAPMVDINQPGTSHTVKAYVSPAAPGVKVNFEVLPGSVNHGKKASVSIDIAGVARWNYSDTSTSGGQDNIRVWIDRDWSGSFDTSNDPSVELKGIWTEEFVTAGGNILDGDTLTWTFAGSVGILGRDTVGDFELVDHVRKVIYRSVNFSPTNRLFPPGTQGPPIGSPSASTKTANFNGTFTNNLNASTINLVIWMVDAGEPGANLDRISVKTGPAGVPGTIWIGTPNLESSSPPPPNPYATPIPISSGNIRVHQ